MNQATPPIRPLPPVHHIWVASDGDQGRLARASVVRSSSSRQWVVLGVVLVAGLLLSLTGGVVGAISWIFGMAVALAIIFGSAMARYNRVLAPVAYSGAVWTTGFGPASLMIANPLTTQIIDYAAVKSIDAGNDYVTIRTRASVIPTTIPAALFPPEAQSFVNQTLSGIG
ncbi:hypothetical protein GCM10027169_25830 [Gordonia jinhuaensis]|uniref:Uncharacterized protein n=2 Tax=Gordonia jinhuaensis TaxID=1517702 RepID=A0A916TCZ6_9ACTN|nr:hypothetical protein GCM10011489_28280 [Gordonia jinhuaensis]